MDDRQLERRFDRVEMRLLAIAWAIVSGGVAMATAVFWLASRINLQNGRIGKNEERSFEARNDLRIVRYVGATFMLVLVPVAAFVIINAIKID